MTTLAAQHASPLPPGAEVHTFPRRSLRCVVRGSYLGDLAPGAALFALWAAAWIFLAVGVAAPAGRFHAGSVSPERADGGALAAARFPVHRELEPAMDDPARIIPSGVRCARCDRAYDVNAVAVAARQCNGTGGVR